MDELVYENKEHRCKIYCSSLLSDEKKQEMRRKWEAYYALNKNNGVLTELIEEFYFDGDI